MLPEEEGDGSARVPDRIGEGGGGGGLTWSEKKTAKAVRRRMPRSCFCILAATRSSGDLPPEGSRRGREEERRVYQRRPPLEYEGETRKVREGESEGERRDSAEDMGISPTSYLVVARGIKPRYYYQLSSSAGLYPSLLLWHVPGGTVETA